MSLIALVVLLVVAGACLKKTYQQVGIKFLQGTSVTKIVAEVKADYGESLLVGDTVLVCCNDGKQWRVVKRGHFSINTKSKIVAKDSQCYLQAIITEKLD